MIRDEDILLDNARKLVDTHPELYLQLLRMRTENRDDSRMLSIGLEAMDRISDDLKVRGEAALITSCYAGRLGLEDVREKCWLEALRSDTTATNYMRIKFLSSDAAKYEEEISSIVESGLAEINNSKEIYSLRVENEKENRIVLNDLCVMLFFEKRFSDMEAVGMPGEGYKGRSAAFMKAGVAFVLLLLSFGDGYSAGMDEMIIRAMEACGFSKMALCQGIEFNDNKADKKCFLEIFDRWKGTVILSEEEELIWIGKLERWVNRIIVGMMQDINSRDHYGECAAFIAAFGEVKEDLFEVGAKDSILRHYKEMYPRRRVFHEELRRYGNGKKNNSYRF
ncbi:hypothetical protein UYO_2976 [Lachnospiraceae bacterium JC7]|nr:hypothetical protein UYO_2976 [Lachnospiraceae bacterium JC7]